MTGKDEKTVLEKRGVDVFELRVGERRQFHTRDGRAKSFTRYGCNGWCSHADPLARLDYHFSTFCAAGRSR